MRTYHNVIYLTSEIHLDCAISLIIDPLGIISQDLKPLGYFPLECLPFRYFPVQIPYYWDYPYYVSNSLLQYYTLYQCPIPGTISCGYHHFTMTLAPEWPWPYPGLLPNTVS